MIKRLKLLALFCLIPMSHSWADLRSPYLADTVTSTPAKQLTPEEQIQKVVEDIKKLSEQDSVDYEISRYQRLSEQVSNPPLIDIAFYLLKGRQSKIYKIKDSIVEAAKTKAPIIEVFYYKNYSSSYHVYVPNFDPDYYLKRGAEIEIAELNKKIWKKAFEESAPIFELNRYQEIRKAVPSIPATDADYFIKIGNKTELTRLANKIKSASEKGDPTSEISAYQARCKALKCTPEIDVEIYRQKGYRAEMTTWVSEIIKVSQFRPPTNEIAEYQKANSQLNEPFQLDTSLYIKNGAIRSQARKTTCTPINHIDKFGPSQDQEQVGWCYAYALADTIKYYTGMDASPVDLSRGSFNFIGKLFDIIDYGDVGQQSTTLDKITQDGVCQIEDLPASHINGTDLNAPGLIKNLLRAKEKYDQIFHAMVISREPETVLLFNKQREELLNSIDGDLKDKWQAVFKNLSKEEIKDIFQKYSYNDMVPALINKNCQARRHYINLKMVLSPILKKGSPDSFIKIDQILNAKKIVGISYHGSFLRNKYRSELAVHVSNIIGRRFNEGTGSCEYYIKNSWGTSCGSYDNSFECINGNIWVPEEFLARYLIDLEYVK